MTAPPVGLELPPIHAPFEPAIHPRVRQVEQRAVEWIEASGMCATAEERAWVVATHSTDFCARFQPYAADDDRLLASSLWVYWGFAFDDVRCDSGWFSTRPAEFTRLAGRVQRALESPGAHGDDERFIAPIRDIGARLAGFGSHVAFRRFAAAQRAWLSGVSWQIGNAAAGNWTGPRSAR